MVRRMLAARLFFLISQNKKRRRSPLLSIEQGDYPKSLSNMFNKNILIVTASIGSGHNKAAAAIADELRLKVPQARVTVIDFMSSQTAYLNKFMKDIYLKMLDLMPSVYEFFYKLSSDRRNGTLLQALFAYFMQRDMAALIKKSHADIVICTHPFPCAAASFLKRSGNLKFRLFTAITDFCLHQFWVYKEVDMYFVAHERVRNELIKHHIKAEHINVTGIPINRAFTKTYDRESLRQKYGLKAHMPAVLIMGGGLGLGGVRYALAQLEKLSIPLQILVVTGSNAALQRELKSYTAISRHKIRVWGYTHNVNELMAISTLLISKPGALTISEAMAMELPMILHEPIPGPESENAAYLADNGGAICIRRRENMSGIVKDLLSDAQRLEWIKKQLNRLKRPDAAPKAVEIIIASCSPSQGGNKN